MVVETHILDDLMHRLGWDLKFTCSQPGRMAGGEYFIPPKDCFDWVAACGCGTYVASRAFFGGNSPNVLTIFYRIIAFAIACGMRVKETRAKFLEMTDALRAGSESEVYRHLQSMLPTTRQGMTFAGESIQDSPSLINVWLPAETNVTKNRGIW